MLILILTLLDGGSVVMKCDDINLPLKTKYGSMVIPVGQTMDVNIGVHYAPGKEKEMEAYVKGLGSSDYRSRETFVKQLQRSARDAHKFLFDYQSSSDAEIVKRVKKLLSAYKTAPVTYDTIITGEGTFKGYIEMESITGESASLGKITVPLTQITRIVVRVEKRKYTVLPNGTWQAAGYFPGGKLGIEASGEVDLWPQQPGQYKCGASGYNTSQTAPGQMTIPGALIGRIGGGQEFYIGNVLRMEGASTGKLELKITPAQWGSSPTGEYEVEVE